MTGGAWPPAVGAVVAACMGALLLGAILVLPAVGLMGQSVRASGLEVDVAAVWSMHPLRALEVLVPSAFGSPTLVQHDLQRLLVSTGAPGLGPSWALGIHLGAPALLLAAAGTVDSRGRILAIGSALLLVLALGSFTPVYEVYRLAYLPERLIRYPERHFAGVVVLVSLLAGRGAHRLLDGPSTSRQLLLVGAGAAAVAVFAFGWYGALTSATAELTSMARGSGVPLSLTETLPIVRDGALTASLSAAAVFGLLVLHRRRRARRFVGGLMCVVVLIPMVPTVWQVSPTVARSVAAQVPRVLEPLSAQVLPSEVPPRVYRPPQLSSRLLSEPEEMAYLVLGSAMANTPVRHGVANLPGFSPAHPPSVIALWNEADGVPLERLMILLGIPYALVPSGPAPGLGLPMLTTSPVGWTLVHSPHARPRAFVAPHWEVAEPGEVIPRMLSSRRSEAGTVRLVPPVRRGTSSPWRAQRRLTGAMCHHARAARARRASLPCPRARVGGAPGSACSRLVGHARRRAGPDREGGLAVPSRMAGARGTSGSL